MQKLLLSTLSFLIFLVFVATPPVAAFVDGEPGFARPSEASLDHCQRRYAERLRLQHREREYQAEKARYGEATARRCGEEKGYDPGFLECLLFVPIFGLFLPFFGTLLIGTLRSTRESTFPCPLSPVGGHRPIRAPENLP